MSKSLLLIMSGLFIAQTPQNTLRNICYELMGNGTFWSVDYRRGNSLLGGITFSSVNGSDVTIWLYQIPNIFEVYEVNGDGTLRSKLLFNPFNPIDSNVRLTVLSKDASNTSQSLETMYVAAVHRILWVEKLILPQQSQAGLCEQNHLDSLIAPFLLPKEKPLKHNTPLRSF